MIVAAASVDEATLAVAATLVVDVVTSVVVEEVEETLKAGRATGAVVIGADAAATSKVTKGDLKSNSKTTVR